MQSLRVWRPRWNCGQKSETKLTTLRRFPIGFRESFLVGFKFSMQSARARFVARFWMQILRLNFGNLGIMCGDLHMVCLDVLQCHVRAAPAGLALAFITTPNRFQSKMIVNVGAWGSQWALGPSWAKEAEETFSGRKTYKAFELAGLRAWGPKKIPKSVIKSVMRFRLTDFLTLMVFTFALQA
jgi:hypothetical protein